MNLRVHTLWPAYLLTSLFVLAASQPIAAQETRSVRKEQVTPVRIDHLHAKVKKVRRVESDPKTAQGILRFWGALDGNRQVDPQIAVGKNHILHGTNSGLTVFDKEGNFIDGVNQNGFQGGIDPKIFYNRTHDVFGFDLWVYWDKAKTKPVNVSISESGDPTKGWNIYSIPAPNGRDGGAIGCSSNWVGYSFPGGDQQTFVMKLQDCKAGRPTTAYHFDGNLGHPVNSQDDRAGLLFFSIQRKDYVIREVTEENGEPVVRVLAKSPHNLKYFGYPPQSPQKGTDKKTASGDRNPKAIVLQNGCLWFSHTINRDGRAAVQWHQVNLKGETVQTGSIHHATQSYIQTTLAVNEDEDVLVGFQETGDDMFISPRMAFRRKDDPPGTLRPMISLGEGKAATEGGSWGDYSGAAIDGANGKDLWTVQSIADPSGRGDTVIAKLPHDHK